MIPKSGSHIYPLKFWFHWSEHLYLKLPGDSDMWLKLKIIGRIESGILRAFMSTICLEARNQPHEPHELDFIAP